MLWCPSPPQSSLIKQLILANESAGGGVVVVMAGREKRTWRATSRRWSWT